MRLHAYVLAVCLLGAASAFAEDLRWTTLDDGRYGSTIDFPAGLFTEKDPPRDIWNGPLRRTRDGRASLYLSGTFRHNMEEPEIELKLHVARAEGAVDYARATPSFFAISYINRGAVHYQRCNYPKGEDVIDCVYITYPQSEAKWWDPVVTRISRSLHGEQIDERRK